MTEAAGTHLERTYIGKILGTVVHWVVLRTIFKVYIRETVYEGGGARRNPGDARRRWKHSSGQPWGISSGRPGESTLVKGNTQWDLGRGGGRGEAIRDLDMLGRRRVTPRWEKDPVWRLDMLGRIQVSLR